MREAVMVSSSISRRLGKAAESASAAYIASKAGMNGSSRDQRRRTPHASGDDRGAGDRHQAHHAPPLRHRAQMTSLKPTTSPRRACTCQPASRVLIRELEITPTFCKDDRTKPQSHGESIMAESEVLSKGRPLALSDLARLRGVPIPISPDGGGLPSSSRRSFQNRIRRDADLVGGQWLQPRR